MAAVTRLKYNFDIPHILSVTKNTDVERSDDKGNYTTLNVSTFAGIVTICSRQNQKSWGKTVYQLG